MMSDDVVVLKVFSSEIRAGMAWQFLQDGGVNAFIFKNDVGGMQPHLQRASGVRLLVNRLEAERAHQILEAITSG
jgi:hypothetical protein